MTHPALIERITRSLAYMLRHQPEQFDLELDRFGYADLMEVVQALNERLDEPIEDDDVEEAVKSGNSIRYEIAKGKIRALYGHSIDVEPGEPSKPTEFLYVGMPVRDAERAMRTGLRGGRRRFLHLALSNEDAAETGRRLAEHYCVVRVHALDAWEEGVNFYDRKSLFLSEAIPTAFLELGEAMDDGEGPPQTRSDRGGGRDTRGRSDSPRGRRPARDDDRTERSDSSGGSARGRGRGRAREDAPREGRESRDGREGRGREPRHEERPRREERPARSERPVREERPARSERPAREERPARSERPAREERPARSSGDNGNRGDRGERKEREPQVQTRDVPRPAPKPAAPAAPADPFGVGVFEAKPSSSAPAPKPAPRAPERREPEPKPAEPKAPAKPDGPGFGEGV